MGRWGYGLFQSELELDAVGDLDIDCGLNKLRSKTSDESDSGDETEDDIASMSQYTLYQPTDPKVVREHIETPDAATGISPLDSALAKWKAKALGKEFYFPSSGQMFIILGACAMSLGCKLSVETIQDLRNVFTKCGLFPDALVQMDAALNGPGRYQGRPWKFVSPDSFEDVDDPEEISKATRCLITKIEARMEAYALEKDDYGVCGAPGCQATQRESGGNLLMCSRCEERRYCSKDCQMKHWKSHKRVCVKAS